VRQIRTPAHGNGEAGKCAKAEEQELACANPGRTSSGISGGGQWGVGGEVGVGTPDVLEAESSSWGTDLE
jgi:hypothetical protein